MRPSASEFGHTAHPSLLNGIPICGVAGDQQAALFGQCCFKPGEAKSTYGTGNFMLVHTGTKAPLSQNRLLTTIVASAPGSSKLEYAIEGSVFVSGALVQWLRDELGLISSAPQTQKLAESVPDTAGVYIVPAFTGLGAPYWDKEARGAILGLTRGANKAHIVRATLEAMAYQLSDLIKAVQADTMLSLKSLKVDGGAASNDFLLQFQSDILNIDIVRPQNTEATALGAAFLAGLTCGLWKDVAELCSLINAEDVSVFSPQMSEEKRQDLLDGWSKAVNRILH